MVGIQLLSNVLDLENCYKDFKNKNMPTNLKGFGEYHEIWQILNLYHPKNIIEVGCWYGFCSILFAKYLKESKSEDPFVISVDTWLGGVDHWIENKNGVVTISDFVKNDLNIKNAEPNFYFEFLNNVAKSGYSEYILPLRQTSANAGVILKNLGVKADLIYVDGSHETKDCYDDLNLYWDLLSDNGVLLIDDLHCINITDAIQQFMQYKNLNQSCLINYFPRAIITKSNSGV